MAKLKQFGLSALRETAHPQYGDYAKRLHDIKNALIKDYYEYKDARDEAQGRQKAAHEAQDKEAYKKASHEYHKYAELESDTRMAINDILAAISRFEGGMALAFRGNDAERPK